MLAGPGGCALVSQPAGQVRDGRAVVGVAAEHLRDQYRLTLDDLVGGTAKVGLADVPVAERGAGQHVDRPGAGAVGLAAPVPLGQLRFLVLGEDALELHQQLVFRGVAARALDELHPDPGAGEFLQQQRLVGELAGQPVRGVAQHHVQAALGGQVPQRLQGRADQRQVPCSCWMNPAFSGQPPSKPGVHLSMHRAFQRFMPRVRRGSRGCTRDSGRRR